MPAEPAAEQRETITTAWHHSPAMTIQPPHHDQRLTPLLEAFSPSDPLRVRLIEVLETLPVEVIADFLQEPTLHIHPIEKRSVFGITRRTSETAAPSSLTFLSLPGKDGRGSRCVTLKRKLEKDHASFCRYVIAHELAHAYLRNGHWGNITDREEAADALAASWGFSRERSKATER